MKIVITGALGHIGSRLVRKLPEDFPGAELVLIDNLSAQRYASLFNLPQGARYRFKEADVLKSDLAAYFDGAQAVVHLAAITDAASSFGNAEKVEEVNLVGTEKVARACAKTGAALVFLSTTSVYGTQAETVDEDSPDLRPQSPYASSKLKAEELLTTLGADEGLRFVTCRFGTIFGTSVGMRFHTAVNKFCWQAVMGLPITVWRTALHQRRPYLDLGDAVRALALILKTNLCDHRIYNVVTTNATVNDVLERIRTYAGDIAVELTDAQIMNQLSYTVLSERFRSLGFEFRGDLDEGVRETIELLKAAGARD